MPSIFISAIITNGASILLEHDTTRSVGYSLPRFPFGDEEDSIEDSLALRLLDRLSIEVHGQEFVETVYEREPETGEVTLNNLQFITSWDGSPPGSTASGSNVIWASFYDLSALGLADDLLAPLQATLGLPSAGPTPDAATTNIGRIIVVTGPAGAGKSTVARRLCESVTRSALISLDQLWHAAIAGAPVPRWSGGDPAASEALELLTLRQAGMLARSWSEAGYDTVIDGVLEQARDLDTVLNETESAPLYLVTLMPSSGVLRQRDRGRAPTQQMGDRGQELHRVFMINGEFRGLHLDNSPMTADETARLIFEHLDEARVR
jgi:chloramphenicol 3-O-phosphotransferase